MEIKTKYNINDTVVFLAENKIWTGSIAAVYVTACICKNAHVKYDVKYDVKCVIPDDREFLGLESNRLFKTKEALVESLL